MVLYLIIETDGTYQAFVKSYYLTSCLNNTMLFSYITNTYLFFLFIFVWLDKQARLEMFVQ